MGEVRGPGHKAAGAGGVGYAVGLRPMASDGAKNDERAGRVAADLKETEDLLAGFDRPGRTPRVPPVQRDFVDYHLDKGQSKPAPRSPGLAADRARRDLPTAIIPNHKRKLPAWVPWAAALVAMSGGGVFVAAMLAGPPNAGSSTNAGAATSPTPSATTTLASGPPALDPTTGPARDIPPPPPSTAEATPALDPDPDLDPGASAAHRPTRPVATTKPAAPSVAPAVTTARSAPAASSIPMPATAPAASSAPSATPSVDLIRHL